MIVIRQSARRRVAISSILSVLLLFGMGCNLTNLMFSKDTILEDREATRAMATMDAVIREATEEAQPKPERVDEDLEPNSAQEYSWQMGTRCIDAPGEDPCPIDACVTKADQYSFTMEVTTELFGKANPDNYQCGADFRFTNQSGADLHIWYSVNSTSQASGLWSLKELTREDIWEESHFNYYSRHEGVVMYQYVPELLVVYDNPHCNWVLTSNYKWGGYKVPVMNPCGN